MLYNIVKVKIYLQINKKGCVYLWQKWQNLQVPVNQVNNVQYVLNAVNTATYNTNPAAPILIAAWVYVALQIYFIPIHIIFINNLPLAKGGIFFG